MRMKRNRRAVVLAVICFCASAAEAALIGHLLPTPAVAALERCRMPFDYNNGEISGVVESPWPEIFIEDRPLKTAKDLVSGENHFWRRCGAQKDWHADNPRRLWDMRAMSVVITRMTADSEAKARAFVAKTMETHGGVKLDARRDPTGMLSSYRQFDDLGTLPIEGHETPVYCAYRGGGGSRCLLAYFPAAAPDGGRYVYYAIRTTDIYMDEMFLTPLLASLRFSPKAHASESKGSRTTLELWSNQRTYVRN